MNYPVDLELRRRVAEIQRAEHPVVMEWGNLYFNRSTNLKHKWVVLVPEYEHSFDAILPLIAQIPWNDFYDVTRQKWLANESVSYAEYILRMSPADYCRSYIAVKESQITPAQQEK